MSWGWMVWLFIVFPIAAFVLQFVFLFISMYGDITFEFPIILMPVFAFMGVFFWWLYIIGEKLNNRLLDTSRIENSWFKKSMYLCIATLILSFFYVLTFDVFMELDTIIAGWVSTILAFLLFITMLLVTTAYIYNIYFVSTVLNALFKDRKKNSGTIDSLPYFIKVWVFPIGIPLINADIRKYNN